MSEPPPPPPPPVPPPSNSQQVPAPVVPLQGSESSSAPQNTSSEPSTVPGGGGGSVMDTSADIVDVATSTNTPVTMQTAADPHRSLLASIPTQYNQPHAYEQWQSMPPPHQFYAYQQHMQTVPPPSASPFGYMGHAPYPFHGGFPHPPPIHYQPHSETDQSSTPQTKGKRRMTEHDEAQEHHEARIASYVGRLRNAGVGDAIINSLDLYSDVGINSAEELIRNYSGHQTSLRTMEERLNRLQSTVERLVQVGIPPPEQPEARQPSRDTTSTNPSRASSSSRTRQSASSSSLRAQTQTTGRSRRRESSPPRATESREGDSSTPGHFARPLASSLAQSTEPASKHRRQGSTAGTSSSIYADPAVVDAQQAAIWHPPAGQTGLIGDESTTWRYSGQIRVQLPGRLPPNTEVLRDQSHPEAYGPLGSDEELDEDDDDEPRRKKKSKGKKKAQNEPSTSQSTIDNLSDLEGRRGIIHDFWGMNPAPVGPDHIRDNRMRGMLSRYVFHDPRNNIVYAGQTAIKAANAALKRVDFEGDVGKKSIRRATHWGLPTTPRSTARLIRLAQDTYAHHHVRFEAYTLLTELYNIAQTVIPEVRDDSMEYIMANFDPEEIGDQFDSIRRRTPEIPRNWASARVSNPSNWTEGMGFAQPTGADLFDIDRLGRYLLAHGRPGSQNFVYGTQFDYRRAFHRRSIFGYALARFFGPPETGRGRSRNGHVLFTRSLAILMASPQMYRDLIQQWNERHPDRLYTPQTGRVCYFRPMLLDDESINDINVDTVAEVLIHNGVPTDWIDHAYNFGVYYLNQLYNGDANHQIIFDEADNERVRCLDQYGLPPAMPEWDGWKLPDETDLIRSYYFEQRELEKFGPNAPQRGYWEIAGPSGGSNVERWLSFHPNTFNNSFDVMLVIEVALYPHDTYCATTQATLTTLVYPIKGLNYLGVNAHLIYVSGLATQLPPIIQDHVTDRTAAPAPLLANTQPAAPPEPESPGYIPTPAEVEARIGNIPDTDSCYLVSRGRKPGIYATK
ncbi:hypothetical protein AGABI2DRAFT_141953 [Agaricus bisporus var. bisporus H97]|uniref:hypothetical protein n=1 Tax=Agaricus bisporus var. bisporus (strain H97 / ATCC MYA-4626 / FGSC 10389) TaxID=936046 RepID=UPI00029F6BD1|nr:hypothetical protein AGABI2DRAFT_141953 [Agaricus bisporus var. bisporus H97]EKV49336.1 hypothetical protein AGABI2DRAFT_141953 [Agaricus bisporus var. bisporus H97]